jgi:NAD(P)-dependent dehydrogenase (short-subunit alcohol dehydrogenase family)
MHTANSGIGFELAAQLLAKPRYHVLLTARSKAKGKAALQDLQSRKLPGTVEMLHLDVADDDTIDRAAAEVGTKQGRLDILVNNAAIAYFEGSLRHKMLKSLDTNSIGPLVVAQAFLPLLEKSQDARIVNVSSGMGSITQRRNSSSRVYKTQYNSYRISKAALNMATACQMVDYEDKGIKVCAYDPGFTISNLGGHNTEENGARKVELSVAPWWMSWRGREMEKPAV